MLIDVTEKPEHINSNVKLETPSTHLNETHWTATVCLLILWETLWNNQLRKVYSTIYPKKSKAKKRKEKKKGSCWTDMTVYSTEQVI